MDVGAVVVQQQVVLQAELRLVEAPRVTDHVRALGRVTVQARQVSGQRDWFDVVGNVLEFEDGCVQTRAARWVPPPEPGDPEPLCREVAIESSEGDDGLPGREPFGHNVTVRDEDSVG